MYMHQSEIFGITEIFPKGKIFEFSSYVFRGFQQIMNRKFTDKGNCGAVIFVREDLEVILGQAFRGLTGGFLLLRIFSVAISVSPHV